MIKKYKLLLISFIALLLYGCGATSQVDDNKNLIPAQMSVLPATSSDIYIGKSTMDVKKVFERECYGCHGLNHEGGVGSNLRPSVITNKNSNSLVETIINGKAGTAMFSFKEKFSKEDAKKMVHYLKHFKGTNTTFSEIYFERECQGCHALNQKNGANTLVPDDITDRSSSYMANIILNGKVDTEMPPFKDSFSEKRLKEMVKYLKTFKLPKTSTTQYSLSNELLVKLNTNQIIWDGSISDIKNSKKILLNFIKQKYPQKYYSLSNSDDTWLNLINWQDNLDTKNIKVTFSGAQQYCENLNFNGYTNWKLPSDKQLKYFYVYSNYSLNSIKYYSNSSYWSNTGTLVKFKGSRVNMIGTRTPMKRDQTYNIRCITEISTTKLFEILTNQEKISTITNYLISKKYNLKKDKFEKTVDFRERVDYVKNNIESITNTNMTKAYNEIYGQPLIEATNYDADNELFYGALKSSKGKLSNKIAINIPLDIAEEFYSAPKKTKVIYQYKNEKVYLKNIIISYNGKEYTAVLDDTNYKPSDIKVAIYKQIKYGEKLITKLQNDIPKLLKKTKSHKIDNTKWLFIVGIENYEYTDSVQYSVNSAKEFKMVMKTRLGIPESNIRTLIDKGATSSKIDFRLKDMLRKVKKGDTIYFYYSGHGIPVPSQNNTPYMLAQDMNPAYLNDERFKLQNIYMQLSNSKASKVVAFVDSCFSGGTDNQALIKGVAATRLKPKPVTFDKNKMIVISAGSGTQYSNKYDEKSNRLFSYYVMRGLINNNTDTQRLYDYVKSNVQEKSYEMGASYEQVPVFDGNIKLDL